MNLASYPRNVLTLEQVRDILEQRQYRPGWRLTAYLGETTADVIVEILATVPDSWNPGLSVPLELYCTVPTPALDDELAFDRWLSWRLQRAEVHESQEWYRRPGRDQPWVPVFNPHADGADRDQWPIVKREHPPARDVTR